MSRNHWNLLRALVCGAVLCACSDDNNVDVVDKVDPNADFTAYKTFAISEPTDVKIPRDVAVNLATANAAIVRELQDRGLRQVDADADPDLVAFSLASTREETGLAWACAPGYWYGYWAWSYDPCDYVSPYYDEFTVGTLVVGLSDQSLDKVVFGGVARGVLDDSNPTSEIDKAVKDIFDDYPEKQTGSK